MADSRAGGGGATAVAPPIATAVAPAMGGFEFVAFIALSMASGALAVDLMLPTLHAIGEDFGLANANRSQAVIAVFVLGMGVPQLLFGPVSDRFGRRPVILGGLVVFVLGGAAAALAPDFPSLLVARLLQGLGAGAQRVVTLSIVRDRHSGPHMAHAMSLVMTVLLLEPIISPLLGQLVLAAGSWRWVVGTVALAGSAMLTWALLRLEESLPFQARRSISPRSVAAAYRTVATSGAAFGYMLALGLVMGAHMGFLTSAQAIFQTTFGAGLRFAPLLAALSFVTCGAAFANARLVRRYGSPRLIRAAFAALAANNLLALGAAAADAANLPVFLLLQACSMFAFGVLVPNLTAMAMSPLGSIAGTASSMVGFLSTTLGGLLGFAVGQLFDGTIRPVLAGYVIMSVAALLVVSRGGRGR
jgi:MFS transporter, DHA1 family, multidrug resistance protein